MQFQRAIGGMRRTRFDQTFPPRFQNTPMATPPAGTAGTAGASGSVDSAALSYLTDLDPVAESQIRQQMQRMQRRSSITIAATSHMAMSFDDAGPSAPTPGGPNHHHHHSGRRREGQGSLLLRSLMDRPTKPVVTLRKHPIHGRPVIQTKRRDRAYGTTGGGGGGGGLTRLQRATLGRAGQRVGAGHRQPRSSKGSMLKDHLSAASVSRRFGPQFIQTVQEELSMSSFSLSSDDKDSVASARSPTPPPTPTPTPTRTGLRRDIKQKNLEGGHIILLPDEEDEGLGTSPVHAARAFAIPPAPPLPPCMHVPLPASWRHPQLKPRPNQNHIHGHNTPKRPGWRVSPTTKQQQQQQQCRSANHGGPGLVPGSGPPPFSSGVPPASSSASLIGSPVSSRKHSQHTSPSGPPSTPAGPHRHDHGHAVSPPSNARARRESASKLADAFDTAKKGLDKHMAKTYFNEALSLQLGGSASDSESSRPPDIAGALMHYELAAKLGHAKSMVNAAQIHLSRSADPASGAVQDPAVHTAKAVRLLQQACRTDDVRALTFYGTLLCAGDSRLGIAANPRRAVELLRRAANWRSAEALLQLSRCYQTGAGVGYTNPTMAFSLCKAAAKEGLAAAQYNLGVYYTHGCPQGGCPLDHEKARWWFEKAATNGHPGAAHNLVVMASAPADLAGLRHPDGCCR